VEMEMDMIPNILKKLPTRSEELAALVARSKTLKPTGARITFIIDATGSRSTNWAEATAIQSRMVTEAAIYGKLSMQIIHFGGGRVRAYPLDWTSSAEAIIDYMQGISCLPGGTRHVEALYTAIETPTPPTLIVAIGDAFEEHLVDLFAPLEAVKALKIPIFSFYEEKLPNPSAEGAFRMMAKETGGVFARFGDKLDFSSLMIATAVYATGGAKALTAIAKATGPKAKTAAELLRLLPPAK
jgi:hypothetical protein